APAHDRFTSKTAICPYDDSHFAAKTLANSGHDLLKGFNGPLAGIAFAISQLGQKRNIAAKTVQRQVAVVPIITIKVASFLAAVERIVRGVKIQHDLGALARNGF